MELGWYVDCAGGGSFDYIVSNDPYINNVYFIFGVFKANYLQTGNLLLSYHKIDKPPRLIEILYGVDFGQEAKNEIQRQNNILSQEADLY